MTATSLGTAARALDYYLVLAGQSGPEVRGIVVEEFVRHGDHTTAGLDSAGWTASDDGWWNSASFSRDMRGDPEVRARVMPTSRQVAESVHRRLGGVDLPAEAVLRTYFRDRLDLASAPPLRLGPAQPPSGFLERRVYRVLFAGDLRPEQVAHLRSRWTGGCDGGSHASGHLDDGGTLFTWDLRRIGRGLAWCVDLTVLMRSGATDTAVGGALSELTDALREQGLIPVTTERFA
ncbi:hypothetical protein ACFY1S_01325 [Micromonospora sp. NPDC000663]|uniref:hypothetical protein n=1 Tax=Micromonospora sp. NPDC000663 TaxID=3364218 RepID=UPI003697777B